MKKTIQKQQCLQETNGQSYIHTTSPIKRFRQSNLSNLSISEIKDGLSMDKFRDFREEKQVINMLSDSHDSFFNKDILSSSAKWSDKLYGIETSQKFVETRTDCRKIQKKQHKTDVMPRSLEFNKEIKRKSRSSSKNTIETITQQQINIKQTPQNNSLQEYYSCRNSQYGIKKQIPPYSLDNLHGGRFDRNTELKSLTSYKSRQFKQIKTLKSVKILTNLYEIPITLCQQNRDQKQIKCHQIWSDELKIEINDINYSAFDFNSNNFLQDIKLNEYPQMQVPPKVSLFEKNIKQPISNEKIRQTIPKYEEKKSAYFGLSKQSSSISINNSETSMPNILSRQKNLQYYPIESEKDLDLLEKEEIKSQVETNDTSLKFQLTTFVRQKTKSQTQKQIRNHSFSPTFRFLNASLNNPMNRNTEHLIQKLT